MTYPNKVGKKDYLQTMEKILTVASPTKMSFTKIVNLENFSRASEQLSTGQIRLSNIKFSCFVLADINVYSSDRDENYVVVFKNIRKVNKKKFEESLQSNFIEEITIEQKHKKIVEKCNRWATPDVSKSVFMMIMNEELSKFLQFEDIIEEEDYFYVFFVDKDFLLTLHKLHFSVLI